MKENYLTIADETSMLALGTNLARACGDTAVIFLHGPLGAGKTTLARGFLRGIGYVGKVKSPTYTLVEPYQIASGNVYHFDFYRLRDPLELDYMGIRDYFVPKSICLIEWPEYGEGVLPVADIACFIKIREDQRDIKLVAQTSIGNQIIERMQHEG
jgi:tRNA threonylcarbamoyladenosine biosynthesis protein TsaE